MTNIHKLAILPNQQSINLLAAFSNEFNSQHFDFTTVLSKLKKTILDSEFMNKHNNATWMATRGQDFLANPKLFASAPLTYICVFLGELFNNAEVAEIQEKISPNVIEHALKRLNDFKLNA
ncbi:hypothetical protein [Psychromonas ossibalaenae]|uniref:hypothetical protein n=1 Tax=Psychromonas ossibalaenae TaxID=444922 RepID=UPI000362EBB1|nr:hypothetical protein [Psychromonas ossibalaenae]